MKLPKFMTASFEESLILQDDSLIDYMIKKGDPKELYKRPVLKLFLVLPAIALLYGMTYFYYHHDPDSPVPIPTINFLPQWLFWLLLILWLSSIFLLNKNKVFYLKQEKYHFHSNNFLIWLVIEVNLFFLTYLFIPLTVFGVVVLFGLIALISYAVGRSKLRALNKQLFNIERKNDKIDDLIQKSMKLVMRYGWIVVIAVVLWKFIFPETTGVRTDIVGFIGVIAMWLIVNIALVIAEIYLFLPYLLYAYYRWKYPEQYREWENKSQLEWYGEKYFNKRIKGTSLEKKGGG
ncbi:hypothetical protein RyT2_27790 [Pseudolactococcus yaeyamensis]